jgi:hypothetical protein
MSWSVNLVGKPEALKRALDAYGDKLTDQSKEEFDAAPPHLKGLLDAADEKSAVLLNASGHASFNVIDGERKRIYSNIGVDIRQLGYLAE